MGTVSYFPNSITPTPGWENATAAGIATGTNIATNAAKVFGAATSVVKDIPVIGSIAGAIIDVVRLFFHGANPNQVYSAKLQQTAESASLNIQALVKAGYIDIDTGVAIEKTILSEAIANMTNLQAKIGDLGGLRGMTKDIQDEINTTMGLPKIPLKTFTVEDAQALFIQPGTKGWYADSLSQGIQLCEQILNHYIQPSNSPGGGLQQATPITTASNSLSNALTTGDLSGIESIIISNPITSLLVAILVFIIFFKFMK